MTDILSGEIYHPLTPFNTLFEPSQKFMCFDQQKTNMFWLVEPKVDTVGIVAALDSPVALAINSRMDAATRERLRGLPMQFVEYWLDIDKNGDAALTMDCPPGYQEHMILRARQAQDRLLQFREDGNVVSINFRRRA